MKQFFMHKTDSTRKKTFKSKERNAKKKNAFKINVQC